MAWGHAEGNGSRAAQRPMDLWAEYFQLKLPDELPQFMRSCAEMVALTAEVKIAVTQLVGRENTDMLLSRWREVEGVTSNWPAVGAIGNMQGFMAALSETGLFTLQVIGDTLGRHIVERQLDDATVDDLRRQVRVAIDLLQDADDLDEEVRSWLLARFWDIHHRLDQYSVTGNAGLDAVLDQTLGGLNRRPIWLAKLGTSKVAQGVAHVLLLIDVTLQSTVAIQQLTSAPTPSPAVTVVVQHIAPDSLADPLPTLEGEIVDAEIDVDPKA